jgi:peptidoglycan/LPS O-acetylase OafA/YrhL
VRERVEQVDGIRGVAALLIAVFYHNFYMGGQPLYSGPLGSWEPFVWIYRWGWTLVDLFFVLSGFIFAHVYLDHDCSLKPGTTIGRFAWARFARLYPLHLLTLCVCAALVIIADKLGMPDYHSSTPGTFLENLLFLQAWHGGFNNVSWSLSIEALCYALFVMTAKRRMLWCIGPALILVGFSFSMSEQFDSPIGSVARGLLGFFMGIQLWRHQRAFSGVPTWALSAVAALAFVLPDGPLHYHVLLDFTLWPAILLMALRFRCPSALRWLGDRSYSIYLVHMPIYYSVHIAVGGAKLAYPLDAFAMALATVAILIVADLSLRYFETPVRKALRGERVPGHLRNAAKAYQ